jgi:O-methyltransferase
MLDCRATEGGTVKEFFMSMIRSALQKAGFNITPHKQIAPGFVYPPDFSTANMEICEIVNPYTMTSPERVNALIEAVEYVVENGLDGSFVECGVWKGGSALAMILALQRLGKSDRDIYLFDTFEGMTTPTDLDQSYRKESAQSLMDANDKETSWVWAKAGIDQVRQLIEGSGYPSGKVHFCKGPVEETIPHHAPQTISLLRLDTDWYESTRHELQHLFPRLASGGVLIIDDYGHWEGARKAVDEYISDNKIQILLNRIDYTGRIAVKNPMNRTSNKAI